MMQQCKNVIDMWRRTQSKHGSGGKKERKKKTGKLEMQTLCEVDQVWIKNIHT